MQLVLSKIWSIALSLYLINMGVGLAAQMRWYHFGLTHHILYFLVFVSAIGATLVSLHPLMLLTLSALTYMPFSKPGTWRHPTAASFGLLGYFLPFVLGGY